MNRPRQFLALLAGGVGAAAALLAAPIAAADESGGGGADNSMAPACEVTGGGGDGQSTICASPGNDSLNVQPNDLGVEGALVDSIGGAFAFGGF